MKPPGEISAINNCSQVLTDPDGDYKLSAKEALKAFSTLSLYTNAEPCPMVITLSRSSAFAASTDELYSVLQPFDGLGLQNAFMELVLNRWLERDGAKYRYIRMKYLQNQRSYQV